MERELTKFIILLVALFSLKAFSAEQQQPSTESSERESTEIDLSSKQLQNIKNSIKKPARDSVHHLNSPPKNA